MTTKLHVLSPAALETNQKFMVAFLEGIKADNLGKKRLPNGLVFHEGIDAMVSLFEHYLALNKEQPKPHAPDNYERAQDDGPWGPHDDREAIETPKLRWDMQLNTPSSRYIALDQIFRLEVYRGGERDYPWMLECRGGCIKHGGAETLVKAQLDAEAALLEYLRYCMAALLGWTKTDSYTEQKNPRFELRTGKFGQYFYDTEQDLDMPLVDVLNILNNRAQK